MATLKITLVVDAVQYASQTLNLSGGAKDDDLVTLLSLHKWNKHFVRLDKVEDLPLSANPHIIVRFELDAGTPATT